MRQRFGIAQALIGNPGTDHRRRADRGLDPEERNRFLNLLAEIGENVRHHPLEPISWRTCRTFARAWRSSRTAASSWRALRSISSIRPGPHLDEGDRARELRRPYRENTS
jgi:hypothetical protein